MPCRYPARLAPRILSPLLLLCPINCYPVSVLPSILIHLLPLRLSQCLDIFVNGPQSSLMQTVSDKCSLHTLTYVSGPKSSPMQSVSNNSSLIACVFVKNRFGRFLLSPKQRLRASFFHASGLKSASAGCAKRKQSAASFRMAGVWDFSVLQLYPLDSSFAIGLAHAADVV